MKRLLHFFLKNSFFFFFLLLEFIAVVLMFQNNEYQRSTFFSSTNVVVANLFKTTTNITDYLDLKSTNNSLAKENNELRNRIIELENKNWQLNNSQDSTQNNYVRADHSLNYISAKVINASTKKRKNYITLNKGRRDGIEAGMGVVVSDGVVGIVKNVSEKFSVVIPLLNPEINVNTKLKSSNYSGILQWNGGNSQIANLNDIPRHLTVNIGDTLITSGHTTNFPEGINIGTISEYNLEPSDSYYDIKVKLAVNFETLSYVTVIKNHNKDEQLQLEKAAEKVK